jgi:hypothetical protein
MVRKNALAAFLKLYFFEQKIGNQAAETRTLEPQLPDSASCFAIIWNLYPLAVGCELQR